MRAWLVLYDLVPASDNRYPTPRHDYFPPVDLLLVSGLTDKWALPLVAKWRGA